MNSVKAAAALAVFCAASFSAPAFAANGDQSATVSASVTAVCRLDASLLTLAEGQSRANGFSYEACNSSRSFTISADTRPLTEGETLLLGYGSTSTKLDSDGSTVIARRSGPTFRRVPLSLEAGTLKAPLTISLAMSVV